MTFTPITPNDELPTGEVLAINSRDYILVGVLYRGENMIVCGSDEGDLPGIIAYVPAADIVNEFKQQI